MSHCSFYLICCLALLQSQCGLAERKHPLAEQHEPAGEATLDLYLPLPKPLVSVVRRVVATLSGPGMKPIAAELAISPLGPATGTLGAIPAGSGRTLVVEGYDAQAELLFRGEQTDIAVAAGDTTRVRLDMILVKPLAKSSAGALSSTDLSTEFSGDF